MEILLGTPFPVTPGPENGFKSSYGRTPTPFLFLNDGSSLRMFISPSSSINLPLNFKNAALIRGSSPQEGSITFPTYSSSSE
ncbi:hypothetical protein LINPERPRIM_LOCUS37302 [Linum perenne]